LSGGFSGARTLSKTAERRAQKAVAISFFALASYIAYEAITKLARGEHLATSWLGIGLAITSVIIMPFLGTAKKRLGAWLDSEATTGSEVQNLICGWLAAAVLAGLLANTELGWWWLDPAIGLGIAGWAIWEASRPGAARSKAQLKSRRGGSPLRQTHRRPPIGSRAEAALPTLAMAALFRSG
jgi:Co/Zn/Cd efflux system component